MTSDVVQWGEAIVKLTWVPEAEVPDAGLITSVHGMCMYDRNLLLVNLNHRGWDIPGGRIEAGEDPESCFKREAMEEGYVSGRCRLLGYVIVDHTDNPLWTAESAYPKIGYQIYYKMDITHWYSFEREFESNRRSLMSLEQAVEVHHNWNSVLQEILGLALED